ncbi:hypothetical protein B6U91_00855 [Candidatus Pacearchaeota archaeon ex4484_71]|nr:MAG: hypothetical protein B6U91_00855 [Candidatus Pacearchaeota archaeon ex4484_71]
MKHKGNIFFIDILKVIAIVLIIFFHTWYNLKKPIPREVGFVGVSLFFIISGYLLKIRYPRLKELSSKYFKKRYLKIAPPYYLSLILVAVLLGKQAASGNIIGNLISHFLFVDFLFLEYKYGIISPAWFLIPLIMLYLLYPYLNKYNSKYKWFFGAAFLLSLVIKFHEGTLASFSPFFFLGEFLFGMLLAQNRRKEAILISLFSILINPWMGLPFAIFFIFSMEKLKLPENRIIKFLSKQTLWLFLIHESILKVAIGRWKIHHLNTVYSLIILILSWSLIFYASKKITRRLIRN